MSFFRSRSRSNSVYSDNRSTGALSTSGNLATSEPLLDPPANYFPAANNAFVNESQLNKVAQLRNHVDSIMLPINHDYYPNEKGFLTDATLRRYLRARRWDYEVCSKILFDNTVRWRRDYRPDELDPGFIRPEVEVGKMYFNGFDKCGRPIWIIRPRLQNSKDEDRQTKHILFCLERGIRLMPPSVDTIAIIVDFKDAAYANNPSIATCKKFLDILGNHYPERLGIAFVVDSPWFFFATFKLISPFMDPQTRAKIKFVYDKDRPSKEQQQTHDGSDRQWVHLKDYISLDYLESDFGGNHNFVFDIERYWSSFLKRTGSPYKTIDYL
ncbi:CRAL-TRIO domain-containing protein [Fennellomyces sp. T-0311]|nr:CRAL-TRIO domain-containing protein [Fennellomyces sp. T-0311]